MTTVAMIAGMAPSALAIGAGGEFRSPMAIAVIGGLVVATLLSLLFVPAFFTIMDDSAEFLRAYSDASWGRRTNGARQGSKAEVMHAGCSRLRITGAHSAIISS